MAVELFISHHPSDDAHLVALSKVLAPLERAGKVKIWHRLLARAAHSGAAREPAWRAGCRGGRARTADGNDNPRDSHTISIR